MNLQEQATARTHARARTARALRCHRRREICDHRPAGAESRISSRCATFTRPHAAGAAAGLGRGSCGHRQARQRNADGNRAAGRQYRPGRRPNPAPRRDRAVADAARQDARGRSGLQHHDGGSRRHAAARARSRGERRPALSAVAAVGGHLHHRRQSLDQCRRRRGDRARHCALACARPRGRAGRRPRAQQPQQAEEGQYRLRPEEPVHRRGRHARHHHRRGIAAGAAAALGGDRFCRRALAAGRGRSARHRHRAQLPAASPRSR